MINSQRPKIFTIISRNYAAQACVLMNSLAFHEPESELIVVVSDGEVKSSEVGGAKVMRADELVPGSRVRSMSTYYTALEFNTALKPFCFHELMGSSEIVIYLDPDIRLYADLSPLWSAFEQADILLTPHLLQPTQEGGHPSNTDIMRAGVYNLGFLGLRRSPETQAFTRWWIERCVFDCRVDFTAGLFTDQKWVDLAPGFISRSGILRDPGLNVAYWNLPERPLAKSGGVWTAGGVPLRFFHFSGFDPDRPDLLSRHQDRINVQVGTPLSRLLQEYAGAMKVAGSKRISKRRYAFDNFADGRPVTPRMRKAFLEAARFGRDLSSGLSDDHASWILGLDPASVARGQPSNWAGQPWGETYVYASPPEAFDEPWLGPAKNAKKWLVEDMQNAEPRAIAAFRRARADLGAMRPKVDGEQASVLLAVCAGPEATRGRFSVDLLPAGAAKRLTDDAALIKVARLSIPSAAMSDPVALLVACYGVAESAGWPVEMRSRLGMEKINPALVLWRERPDLQRAFNIQRWSDRLRLYHWFNTVAVKEYDLARSLLPPIFRFSPHASWRTAQKIEAVAGRAAVLLCAPTRLSTGIGEQSWYDTTLGTMIGSATLRKRIGICVHYGELAEAALGWIAMHRRGAHVEHHLWAPSPGSIPPTKQDPAWSFVDAVWPSEKWRSNYVKSSSNLAIAMNLQL